MPHRRAIAIVLEPLEHLEPVLIASKKTESRHRLQTHQCERNVRFDSVSVRNPVTENEMRLLYDFLSDELHRILPGMRLRDVGVEALHFGVVLVSENRHVCEHRERMKRWRCRLGSENVHVADTHPRLFSERRIEISIDALEDST